VNPDYRDMLSALIEAQAEFLVVGAYALAAHGLPRATGDIDIWVRPTAENAKKVLDALTTFGAPLDQISLADLSTPGTIFQIGVAPHRIDIMTKIEAVGFDQAWKNRLEVALEEGLQIPVLGRADFITNKRSVGRKKDLADLAWLEGEDEDD
jgi:hypothetical protein